MANKEEILRRSPSFRDRHESRRKIEPKDISKCDQFDEKKLYSNKIEKKFTGRCRLFVGNIPNEMSESDFKDLFEKHGECSELFLNANRGFGFIRMESKSKAEKARSELDGFEVKPGRYLRVRFAGPTAAVKVKYLSQFVSNEMLQQTFSMFGEVENAVIVLDDKGKPTGEGIVDFTRKSAALSALKKINEGIFLMTSQPRPISAELYEQKDETNGIPELFFAKSQELLKERDKTPRFAQPGTFESEMGQKWKKLYQLYKEQEELLRKNFSEEVAKLEADQETALLEQHTQMLRQDLQRRQEELRILEEQTHNEIKRRLELRRQEHDRKRTFTFEEPNRNNESFQMQLESHQIKTLVVLKI